jgi:5-methylcytosine-specific restriction endonuclease McrA
MGSVVFLMPASPPDLSAGRVCVRCGLHKAADDFYVTNRKRGYRDRTCKPCRCVVVKAHRDANPDRVRATKRAYYAKNRGEVIAKVRAWYWSDPERARSLKRSDYQKHRPKRTAYNRAYRAANPGVSARYWEIWKQKNPEAAAAAARDGHARRRARLAGATVVERVDPRVIYERDGGRCHICGRKCKPDNFHLDHLIPVASGEAEFEHSARNLRVAHPKCNQSRGTGRIPAQLLLIG